ncbi:MAG: MBOAT family protein [Acidobacteriaceae bacterium]|nr:MBOAT family protein [Acidobacteriaceae bacterium]
MLLRGSLHGIAFLLCLVVVATVRSPRIRQLVLLLASSVVYLTWTRWFFAVLLTSVVTNFLLARALRRNQSGSLLARGILLNLILLSAFKYVPALAVALPLSSLQGFVHLVLPLGISFWTFQAMSYLFDLYRGEELDPSFVEFALYMAFFPVTISGPICRMPDMLPQFRSVAPIPWESIGRGFERIATGVLMMLFARLLGQGILAGDGINSGFDHATRWSGLDVWCLAFGYGLQLFFDFAGYSHIAIGAAQALGVIVPENFARPFQSTAPSIFWTRWHMSLSFWIRDYVFLPLATLRREVWWRNLTLVISMVLFGLWHKATMLFLLWGAYHGLLLVAHRQIQQTKRRFDWEPDPARWTPLSWLVTIVCVSLGWIFFRANSLGEAGTMLSALVSPATYGSHFLSGSLYLLVIGLSLGYAMVSVAAQALNGTSQESSENARTGLTTLAARWRWYWLPPLYTVTLLFVLMVTLGRGTSTAQFMYGNF